MSTDLNPTPNSFNPYLKWLGIRGDSHDHYQLLGIERFESDADVIVAAADRQMAHVRKYQNGPKSQVSQQLLNELAAAKICLLNADKKLAYDIGLASEQADHRSTMGTSHQGRWLLSTGIVGLAVLAAGLALVILRNDRLGTLPTKSVARPPDNAMAEQKESTPDSSNKDARGTHEGFTLEQSDPDSRIDSNAQVDTPPFARPVEVESPTTGASPVQLVSSEEPAAEQTAGQSTGESGSANQSSIDGKPAADAPNDTQANPDSAPLVTVVDVDPTTKGTDSLPRTDVTPWADGQDRKRPGRPFAGQDTSVAKLLQALQDRNIVAADQLQERVLAEAGNEPKREDARRLELIFFKLKEFWDKADLGLANTSVGDTLEYRGVDVTVVQKSDAVVRLRAPSGKEQDFETDRAKIGGDLAVALARHNGEAQGIMLDVMCGVFLSIDRDGDRKEAGLFLKRAKDNGIPIDVFKASSNENAATSTQLSSYDLPIDEGVEKQGLVDDVAANASGHRNAIPTLAIRNQKLQMLRKEAYKEKYGARGAQAERELATRLFLDANQTQDDPDARYVMYTESIRLAADNGDAKTVDTAIRALVYNFDCAEDPLRLDSLIQLSRSAREPDQIQLIINITTDRIRALIKDDQFQPARQYIPILSSTETRAKMPAATRVASRLESQLDELEQHAQQLQRDLFGFPGPEDAAVYTMLGLYELHKGNDDVALQYLQSSHIDALSRAAAAELDGQSSASAKLDIADLWWSAADVEQSEPTMARIVRDRARHWYASAVNGLVGVSKRRATARLSPSFSRRPQESAAK